MAALADPAPEVRLEAVASLGKLGDPAAIQALAPVLEDPPLRLAGIWALGMIGDRAAIPVLRPLMASEDKYVRHNVRQALKAIGS
jgi:HEAT repeat protein